MVNLAVYILGMAIREIVSLYSSLRSLRILWMIQKNKRKSQK
jgi:hypothetical protein